MINLQLLDLPKSRTSDHGPEKVRALEAFFCILCVLGVGHCSIGWHLLQSFIFIHLKKYLLIHSEGAQTDFNAHRALII